MAAAEKKSWTTEEFRALGLALYGHEWQSALARALGVHPRTVRAWASGRHQIRPKHMAAIEKLLGAKDIVSPEWPRDEWIVGDGPARETGRQRREYLIHTRHPRFIARIVEIDEATGEPEPDEDPADTLSGVVYAANAVTQLCEFVWFDPPPPGPKLHRLLEAAADAVDRA